MDTISCLLRYPWRTLAALAAVYDVTAHHRRPKEQVAQELSAAIHARLPHTLDALDADTDAALRALAQAHGLALPRPDFIAQFGALHPYRPWKPDAPPAPWPTPPSPAATLVHYGLVYPLNLGTRHRPVPVVLLPHGLRDILAPMLALPAPPPAAASPTSPHARPRYGLDADLFTFLSFLNRGEHRVHHGRWLPPRALRALNACLSPPDKLGAGRSELQAARIPFIHYLAERAGLVGLVGDWLKPTPRVQEWLAAPRPQRLSALWDAWRERSAENHALWLRYRLPAVAGDDDPVARFLALLEPLTARPVGPLDPTAELLDALVAREPALLRPQATYATWTALDPGERMDFEERARAVLLDLLTNHSVWFGLLDGQPGKNEAGRQVGESPSQRISNSAAAMALRLTPLGAALLGREDGVWPADPSPALLRVAPLLAPNAGEAHARGDTAVLVDAPPDLPLSDRFALEATVPPALDTPYRYHLTRSHFLRALQRGHTAEGVVNFLERAGGEPLSAPVLGALYRWEEDFNRVTVRQAILLQTRDPGLLRDLAAQRHIRETLGRTLNARTVEVRADRVGALLRRLDWRGIIPRLDLPHSRLGPLPGKGGRVSDDEWAAIAAALRVYAHVADALGLPTRPAYALARRWSEGLPLPLRDAVKRTVERVLDALHRASPLETEDRLPEPTGPLLEALEAAIRDRAVVEIAYTSAGRAHRTTRRVEPLRLEWRGDVVYLVAYCHLRGDERVFRVDRITDVVRDA